MSTSSKIILFLCFCIVALVISVKAEEADEVAITTGLPQTIDLAPQSNKSFKLSLGYKEKLNLFYGQQKGACNKIAIRFENMESSNGVNDISFSIQQKVFECSKSEGCSLKIGISSICTGVGEDATVFVLPFNPKILDLPVSNVSAILIAVILGFAVVVLIVSVTVLGVRLRRVTKELVWYRGNSPNGILPTNSPALANLTPVTVIPSEIPPIMKPSMYAVPKSPNHPEFTNVNLQSTGMNEYQKE
ncbi:hypothetical protein ABK040_011127 [Willaertia magna]